MNKYISKEIFDVVKEIATKHPETVFCGSFGLILNNKLQRDVKDIDIIVKENYYSNNGDCDFFSNKRYIFHAGGVEHDSNHFMVGKNSIKCFKLYFDEIKVDVFYCENNDITPKYNKINIGGVDILVETPESAIKAKKEYVINDKSQNSILKHLKDLIYMETDKNELVDLINNSHLYYKKEKVVERSSDDLPF